MKLDNIFGITKNFVVRHRCIIFAFG